MSLAIERAGEPAKRGLLKRAPRADQLAVEIETWLRAEHDDVLRSLTTDTTDGRHTLTAALHPAADPVVISIDAAGTVEVHAETAGAGPGYHTYVGRLLERLGDAAGIEWSPPTADLVERASVERAHLAWLGRVLARAREAHRGGVTGLHLGTPRGTAFTVRGAVATPLGPRDAAWLDAALANPRVAVEVRPWWTDAMEARYLLDRARTILWLHVRWRPPATDRERADIDEALRLLRRAYPLDPALPFPWRAWDELNARRGVEPDTMTRMVRDRAAAAPDEPPPGYRRDPVTIVHAGWSLPVPGGFSDLRTAAEWSGGEHGRMVSFANLVTGDLRGQPDPDAMLRQVATHLGPSPLDHHDGAVRGRARLAADASSGIEVGTLDGYVAAPGRLAHIRITFDEPDDWEWAVAAWRSLRPA